MSQRTIDPRSAFVFDIREFGHRAGGLKQVEQDVPAPEGIGNDVISVPVGSPIALDLTLEGVGDGVLASGTAELELEGECSRCLTPLSSGETIDLQELFLFPGVDADDLESSRVESEMIDLEPVIRDAAVLDLPFIPLCRPDCAGLCTVCGANLNDDPDHAHADAVDPRWASLAQWSEDER